MDIKVNSPANAFNLHAGQLVLTSDKVFLVASIAINDYKLALVNLQSGETASLLTTGDNVSTVDGSTIMKVLESDQAQLILP